MVFKIGVAIMGLWALVIVYLFYIGFTDSFISDHFFKWEFISLGICAAGMITMIIGTGIDNG